MKLEGKYFIYPNGGIANRISHILSDIYPNVKFEFLDDCKIETSLENNIEKIRANYIKNSKNSRLLLCGGDVQEILEQKCRNFGLDFTDGRELCAEILGKEIKKETQKLLNNLQNNFDIESNANNKLKVSLMQNVEGGGYRLIAKNNLILNSDSIEIESSDLDSSLRASHCDQNDKKNSYSAQNDKKMPRPIQNDEKNSHFIYNNEKEIISIQNDKEAICNNENNFSPTPQTHILEIIKTPLLEHFYYFYDLMSFYLPQKSMQKLLAIIAEYCFVVCENIKKDYPIFAQNLPQKIQKIDSIESILNFKNKKDFEFNPKNAIFMYFSPGYTLPIYDIIKTKASKTKIKWGFGSHEFYDKFSNNPSLMPYLKDNEIIIFPHILLDFFCDCFISFLTGSLVPPLLDSYCAENELLDSIKTTQKDSIKAKIFKDKRVRIGAGHTLCEAYQFFPRNIKNENLIRYIRNYFAGFSHYCAIDKQSKNAFLRVFNAAFSVDYIESKSPKILEIGSLSLDSKFSKMAKSENLSVQICARKDFDCLDSSLRASHFAQNDRKNSYFAQNDRKNSHFDQNDKKESHFALNNEKSRFIQNNKNELNITQNNKNKIDFNTCEFFYFIPRLLRANHLKNVILKLLKAKKKVLLRPHGAYLNYSKYMGITKPYEELAEFENNPLFGIDNLQERISAENLLKSIVITDNSSVGFSSPLSSLRPCILFAPYFMEFDLKAHKFDGSFAIKEIHKIATNEDEFLEIALNLEKEILENGVNLAREIAEFRAKNLYNFGKSAKTLSEEILKHLL